ncbi:hypothetical protein [Pseudomonas sp. OV226]|uniref:hypothetical protein n=1 Tax=Pseudomonas sp. OV226 TaxID=2135588 RepID=UPI000D6B3872|nr:hypothetical protein [Pseudomonas sp. OV226]PWK31092.1 hypothetical protein C7534_1242 [Pseudomonas sp. OV226]
MEDVQNPFQRLYELLDSARKAPNHETSLDVWAKVFKISPSDLPGLIYALRSLMDDVSHCRTVVEKFVPGDKARFLVPLDRVDALLANQNLLTQWNSYKSYLDDATMLGLGFGIYAMSQFHPASSSESSPQINEFIKKLDMLLEECLDSEIAPELKKLFIKHLEAIRAALLGFLVDGGEALEAAVDNAIGSILRHGESIKAEPGSGKEFVKGFFDVLGKVNDLVSGYQTTAQIASSAAVTLLLPLIS